MQLDRQLLIQIEEERKSAPHGMTGAVIQARADSLGVSAATLHRALQNLRGRVKAGGGRRPQYNSAVFDEIARRKVEGMTMATEPREISTEILRNELLTEGLTEEQVPSESRINAVLNARGFRVRKPFKSVVAEFANQQAQLDHSRSKYFQLKSFDATRGDWVLVVKGSELSYKADNQKLRTWITSYKDAFSHIFIARMVPASGESILVGLDHLDFVWNREQDDHPLRFVPYELQTDRGALGKSGPYHQMATALGITVRLAQSKEAQGKVENSFKNLWRGFELPLARRLGEGATIYMSDYNALLMEHSVREAQRAHPRMKRMTREDAFSSSIRMYAPREIDLSVRRLACRIETRKVDSYGKISLNGIEYAVPQYVGGKSRIPTLGMTIRLYQNADREVVGELVERYVDPFKLTLWKPVTLGSFSHDAAPTYRQDVERQVKAERQQRKQERKVRTLPPAPEKIEPQGPFAAIPADALSAHEARVYVAQRLAHTGYRLRDFEDVFAALLAQDNVARKDADQLIQAVLNHINLSKAS